MKYADAIDSFYKRAMQVIHETNELIDAQKGQVLTEKEHNVRLRARNRQREKGIRFRCNILALLITKQKPSEMEDIEDLLKKI